MFENQASEGAGRRSTEHELWLAMQAAYQKYRDATEALDVTASQLQSAISPPEMGLHLETATREQRTAFEEYVEARMEFAEFRYDQNRFGAQGFAGPNAFEGSPGPGQEGGKAASRPLSKISRLALPAAAVALFCTTAFSLAYVARERTQTRNDIQDLVRKLDAVNLTQQLVIREPAGKPAPTPHAPLLPAGEATPDGVERWQRVQVLPAAPKQGNKTDGTPAKLIHPVQNPTGNIRWEFRLPVSRRFQRVGPLQLSLRLVNVKYRYFDLCVMANDFKLKHIKLREPVRINLEGSSRRLELVATRIDKNYVQGYLSEHKYAKAQLTASQARRKSPGGT